MKEFLNYTIFEFGNIHIKVLTLIVLFSFLTFIFLLLHFIKKAIYKTNRIDIGKKFAIYSLIKYCIYVFTVVIGLQILGFNLSVLLAGSAALLVGLGLGLQNLFSDYISGIILLIDSSVKVNDIVDIDGLVCQVQEINLRTTTVLTRDDKYIILPNTALTRNQLINWTHSNVNSRFDINVGVDYSSDVNLVMKLLKEAAEQQNGVLKQPKPFVRFNNYGDSTLDFTVYFWASEVFRVENIKSDVRVRIFELFKQNNINIPFPQRVVHIKEKKEN